ncbi:MAG: UDP-N-acetylglucosamine--N-acetylmuramyl-(pentapeptide) pyrophosphoryl-undecaprenol N-acetylglucosamine transferase [bacterium]|nr:UDP-N-acetylglucosamine--N-acetylmuramyl-(pentapeptide) pyrophosphoryl-undecaprenol N-acetylglucosamine transferase [bacterium]
MKDKTRILLTAGGTGGHIYPLVAVAEAIYRLAAEQNRNIEIKYFGPAGVLNNEFEGRGIKIEKIISSKLRRYFSLNNFIDAPKFVFSFFQALFKIFRFMPDVVFSKGGTGVPMAVILASRFYRIPIIIHESDTIPGLTNLWATRFAGKILISFEKAAQYFPADKTILVGNPIRPEIIREIPDKETAKKTLGFNSAEPVILVIGGSQGALSVNNFILDNLGEILDFAQVIHQSGPINYSETKKDSDFLLKTLGDFYKNRYQLVGYLQDAKAIREAFAAADLVLSRAGSGSIFEIAAFGKPSILIPLEESASDHQKVNAYEYAKTGAAVVMEEANFKSSIFISQAKKILTDPESQNKMSQAAKNFAEPEAAQKIAEEILKSF